MQSVEIFYTIKEKIIFDRLKYWKNITDIHVWDGKVWLEQKKELFLDIIWNREYQNIKTQKHN